MKKLLWIMAALLFSQIAQAEAKYTGQDFSGVYDCTGVDAKEGKYKGTVTMKLTPESYNNYGFYAFRLEAEGFGIYLGDAVSEGNKAAIHFALDKPNTTDSGTGIATFSKNAHGKWSFHKVYYEAAYKGGNHGSEDCVQR